MPTWLGPVQGGAAFMPPVPPPGTTPAARRLFRHYGTVTEGRNFYIYDNGSVTDADPVGAQWDDVAHVLWGAHCEPVTDDEVSLLTAAGFAAYIHDGEYFDTYHDVYSDTEACC